jgi:hypothetical protein
MGIPYSTIQRLFIGSLVAAGLTWFTQENFTDAAYVLIALMALVGIVWVLSEREMTFHHMGLNASGILTLLSFIGSIALFAEVSIRVWDFPTTGSYVLSLFFVGSFWWTGALIQPRNN